MAQLHTWLPHLPLHKILTTIQNAELSNPKRTKTGDATAVSASASEHAQSSGETVSAVTKGAKEGMFCPLPAWHISKILTRMVLLSESPDV